MKKFYEVALLEGEGLGTAYEYYMKRRLLIKLFRKEGHLNSFCVFGLPEKYGTSMDFCLLAGEVKASRVTILDERREVVNKCTAAVTKLRENKLLPDSLPHVKEGLDLKDEKYDFITNCDVFQRFSEEEALKMIESAAENSKLSVFFLPNGFNVSHVPSPGRKAVNPVEFVKKLSSKLAIIGWGYIDMPPFPSGSKISEEKKKAVKSGVFNFAVFVVLKLWAIFEILTPSFIRKKYSHAFYVAVKGK
ncbi:MAG: hypothetical protein A2452_01480 [Candidatus Firestonebacteria bacterium RIFOXYC2_FULL_39_67]|nr:MAG: hypothetical protein A2536_12600 [Candidatus Firestonebacteria bacterium RIFOXYD2_FULL_39_29]OGF57036.1 MAG: hypothetical protein A2452_01480 [Candidatus Firestonebacteria bacterium RIFOXYC2_FULL_39_67]